MANKTDAEKDRPREDIEREDDPVAGEAGEESKQSKSQSAPDSARTGRPIIGEGNTDE